MIKDLTESLKDEEEWVNEAEERDEEAKDTSDELMERLKDADNKSRNEEHNKRRKQLKNMTKSEKLKEAAKSIPKITCFFQKSTSRAKSQQTPPQHHTPPINMEVDINQGEVVEEMEWEVLTEDPAPMEWDCESDQNERRVRRALAQKKSLLVKLSAKEKEKWDVKVFLKRLLMSELNLELKKPALVMVGPVQELGLEIPIKISADVRPGTFKDRDEKRVKGHVISWNITIQVVTDKERLSLTERS